MHEISGVISPPMALVFWVGPCVAVGVISGLLARTEISGWYAGLKKPSFNPPNWIFGPVWTTLYILMGVAAWLIWEQPVSQLRTYALTWFAIQLALNFLWSLIFFAGMLLRERSEKSAFYGLPFWRPWCCSGNCIRSQAG